MINTISLGISLNGTVEEVFEILTNSYEHSSFTSAKSLIKAEEGGAFSYFDGAITGTFIEIVANERIVQSLHAHGWPAKHHATVTLELKSQGKGERTWVHIREDNIPANQVEMVRQGWADYWEQFAAYLRERRTDVVSHFVEQYKNHQNWDAVDEFLAADCKHHLPLPGLPEGREGMRINGKMMCTAFPDVSVTREFFVTEGDIVIERAHAKATHQGELMGITPSGQPITWTELHAYRVQNGQIIEVWSEADFMGVMVQLGAVNLPAGE